MVSLPWSKLNALYCYCYCYCYYWAFSRYDFCDFEKCGNKSQGTKKIPFQRGRSWVVVEYGRNLARGGAVKGRSCAGGMCDWGIGSGTWSGRTSHGRSCAFGRSWEKRIKFVYSKIHSSLQVHEFGQKCPNFNKLEKIFTITQSICGPISFWVYSVVPVNIFAFAP